MTTMRNPKGHPILPIGRVNLKSGKNPLFGTIWNGWEANAEYTNTLLRRLDSSAWDAEFMVVHSCGVGMTVGAKGVHLYHDQTFRRIGDGDWEVIAVVPHTEDGLQKLERITDSKSLRFATFK
jgi:hypothetical protein